MILRITDLAASILKKAIIFILAILCLLVGAQVLIRFLPLKGLTWTEEASRLGLVWLIFLGAALAVHTEEHFVIDSILRSLPTKIGRFVRIFNWFCMTAVACLLIFYGFLYAKKGLIAFSPSLQIPLAWSWSSTFVGGCLILLFLIESAYKAISGISMDEMEQGGEENK